MNVCLLRGLATRVRLRPAALRHSRLLTRLSSGVLRHDSSLQCLPSTAGVRFFCSPGGGSNGPKRSDDPPPPPEEGGKAPADEDPSTGSTTLPASVVVPEVWPQLPLLAINRNPVFPRFIKLVEVSLMGMPASPVQYCKYDSIVNQLHHPAKTIDHLLKASENGLN